MTTLPCDDGKMTWAEWNIWLRKSAWTLAYILACMVTTVLCALAYAHSHGAVL